MLMPRKDQPIEKYLAECAAAGGDDLPRATPEEIEQFKALGYTVRDCVIFHDECAGMFQWLHADGQFQEELESYSEASCWALVKDREQMKLEATLPCEAP